MKERKNKELSSKDLSELVAKGMIEKKGLDIAILDLRKVKNSITDFFVICSGNSDTQIDALANSVEDEVYKMSKTEPWQKEGKANGEWILIDYVDVVAHIFNKDRRKHYDLEELWGDAEVTYLEDSMV
ncbi:MULTISPECIES: ribosome silencing factor [Dyadobacter]|jgi:ribosome-associated protein|uniref:Ribosomal silencing factor RsfS n=3 Tax=Dyadobacter TaxID=120831 RepID=A0A9X1PA23_9BACT|nr:MULTISPECIES: ribosome silencing factor [Dyadobacter]MCF0039525.1 ribosome silencing factor [Dyadobacter fanqingshengii]MCF0053418.1 ribosome silencing factor [Dyadobacter chenwenxiniae]MCF0060851.1 ribosome silencing factor [Dyadobacter chenwenxiniae]MCF2502935.1 ribosome silencing factor [Dyadobacter fanqingshengii]USJ33666.1 ribosome silencing factor [Dyadobacter fanqingshengii]